MYALKYRALTSTIMTWRLFGAALPDLTWLNCKKKKAKW